VEDQVDQEDEVDDDKDFNPLVGEFSILIFLLNQFLALLSQHKSYQN